MLIANLFMRQRGAGVIEGADSAAVENVFQELAEASGATVEFSPDELKGLNGSVDILIASGKLLALPVATVLVMYAGFKKMVEGYEARSRS